MVRIISIPVFSEEEKAWVAGVIDSDGSIMIGRRKPYGCGLSVSYCLQISFINTNRSIVERLYKLSKCGCFQIVNNPNRKTAYSWKTTDRAAASVLTQIMPYLVQKYPQAILGIMFSTTKAALTTKRQLSLMEVQRREDIYQQMKRLKEKNSVTHILASFSDNTFACWLAAMIDCDGCLCIKKAKYFALECVLMCDHYASAQYIQTRLGYGHIHKQRMKSGKELFTWSCYGSALNTLLSLIYTRLIAKQDQATIMKDFLSLPMLTKSNRNDIINRRAVLYQRMQTLKKASDS